MQRNVTGDGLDKFVPGIEDRASDAFGAGGASVGPLDLGRALDRLRDVDRVGQVDAEFRFPGRREHL